MNLENSKLKITYERHINMPESVKAILIGIARETRGDIEIMSCHDDGWAMQYIIGGFTNHCVIIRKNKIEVHLYTMSPCCGGVTEFELNKPDTIEQIINLLKKALYKSNNTHQTDI